MQKNIFNQKYWRNVKKLKKYIDIYHIHIYNKL